MNVYAVKQGDDSIPEGRCIKMQRDGSLFVRDNKPYPVGETLEWFRSTMGSDGVRVRYRVVSCFEKDGLFEALMEPVEWK